MKKVALITTNKILAQSLSVAMRNMEDLEFEFFMLLDANQALIDAEIFKIDVALIDIMDRGIEEKDRFDIVLANPPFGGKEKDQIQANFPIKTNATEMLFLQHFMKKLKVGGKAAIIVPEWVLFNTWNAFQEIKKILTQDFNLHTILSLPSGVFLPYAGVKTNVIFFDRVGSTKNIRYYEVNLDRKLTKNKPITSEELQDFLKCFKDKKITENSWMVDINDIKDYDLSAKNPNKIKEQVHRDPKEIIEDIEKNEKKISELIENIKKIIS